MYEDEEKAVDEAIDYILGSGDGNEADREEETVSTGGAQMGENDEARWDIPGEGTERATCRKCGGMFLKPPKSKRTLCPACFSAQVSAGMKASHAARRAKREARKAEANGRQMKPEDTVQKEWDALEEPAAAPEPEPEPETPIEISVRILMEAQVLRTMAGRYGMSWARLQDALTYAQSVIEDVEGRTWTR